MMVLVRFPFSRLDFCFFGAKKKNLETARYRSRVEHLIGRWIKMVFLLGDWMNVWVYEAITKVNILLNDMNKMRREKLG